MEIYFELYGPIYNMPSKNYPFESYMMVHLPPWPIAKVCKNFGGLPSADKKIDASDDFTPR